MTDCLCPIIEIERDDITAEIRLEMGGGWRKKGKYNLTDQDWLGVPNEEGTLVVSSNEMNPIFNGVKIIDSKILSRKFRGYKGLNDVLFPDLEEINCDEALFFGFGNYYDYVSEMGDSHVRNISFPKLERISGDNALREMVYNAHYVETVSFPSLESVTGDDVFFKTFWKSSIQNVDFSALSVLNGYHTFNQTFLECGSLRTISFPSLHGLTAFCFENAFKNCPNIEEIYFGGLTEESVSDPDQDSVLPYTGYFFKNMLYGCDGVTVHFTADAEDGLMNRPYVLDGFGGTNTTVLYDINCCYVDINVIGSSDYLIYVNDREMQNSFTTDSRDKRCAVLSNDTGCLYYFDLTGLVIGETKEVNVNLADCVNMNKIETGITGLVVDFYWEGKKIKTLDDGVGGYYFYSNVSGLEIDYVVNETEDIRKASGEFVTMDSSQTIVVVPEHKEWLPLDINNMTEDGVIGGDKPAVAGSTMSYGEGYPYRAFDGKDNTWWYTGSEVNQWLILYSPEPVKLAELDFTTTTEGGNTYIYSYVLSGSNDGVNYTQIYSQVVNYAPTFVSHINSDTPYKYFRFDIVKRNSGYFVYVNEITCIGTVYK